MNMISNASTTRWEPGRVPATAIPPTPPLPTVLGRGLRCRCPNCGEGPLFDGYLTVTSVCRSCGAPLGLARADDLPPYLTILLVGHIVVALLFLLETQVQLPLWQVSAIFVPLTLVLTLALLRPIKGATVGLMLHLNLLRSTPNA
jgi:uncharacterized protein (DUF983 family)